MNRTLIRSGYLRKKVNRHVNPEAQILEGITVLK
jgi:hypothetical protein